MTRQSDNVYNTEGRLMSGYDYQNQAWVKNGRYVRCGHPPNTCKCYGRVHEAEMTPVPDNSKNMNTLNSFFGFK